MSKVQITKAQRKRIGDGLAEAIASVFNRARPLVMHKHGYMEARFTKYGADSVHVNTSAGVGTMSIDVSPRLVSVFFRFDSDRMTDAQRGMAVRMGGNFHSGKINFHSAPTSERDRKSTR